jgi:hypothetical protein
MLGILQRRSARNTRLLPRVALVVGAFAVLAMIVSFSSTPPARHSRATSIVADTTNDAPAYGGGNLMAAEPTGGYWTVNWLGVITPHDNAPTFGSPALSGLQLQKPIVGMEATPDGQGYWLVASDGGIFSYGDATFYGSTGNIHLNQPIVGMGTTPDGRGYWLVASDGGIFNFGDAGFYGSTGAIVLNKPIVGMASTPDGGGYWLVASDGGVFTFGDASFYGSTGSIHLNEPIVSLVRTPDGQGYWLVASDGGVFTYGDAQFYGSLGGSGSSVLGMIVSPSAAGYSLVQFDGEASVFQTLAAAGSSVAASDPTTASEPAARPNASQGTDCQPASVPTARVDSSLQSLVTNDNGNGWLGGDGTYSTQLPNGQEAIDFSDTLIGTQTDGVATLTGIPRNSELVGSLSNLNADYAGSFAAPESLIPDHVNDADHYWDAGTYVENGQQLIYVNQFAESVFGVFTGQSGIAVLSLPASGKPTFGWVVPLPTDPDTQWGNAVTRTATYNYIYGLDSDPVSGTFYGMKMARVPNGDSLVLSDWQYWNGAAWVPGEQNAIPVNTGTILTGVTAQEGEGGYIGVSIPGGVYADTTVAVSYSCSPQGPWSAPTPVYTIPQVMDNANEVAYIPTFHPELSSPGQYVISYDINNTTFTNFTTLDHNIDLYQPQFLQLGS